MIIYYDVPFIKDKELHEGLWGWFILNSRQGKVNKSQLVKQDVMKDIVGIKRIETYRKKFKYLLESGYIVDKGTYYEVSNRGRKRVECDENDFIKLIMNDAFRVWLLETNQHYMQKEIGKIMDRDATWVRERQRYFREEQRELSEIEKKMMESEGKSFRGG